MSLMLYISFYFFVTLMVYALCTLRFENRSRVKSRVAWVMEGAEAGSAYEREGVAADSKKLQGNSFTNTLASLVEKGRLFVWKHVQRQFKRNMSDHVEERLDLMLLQAGRPGGMTAVDYRMLQIAMFILMPMLFAGYSLLLKQGIGTIILCILFGFLAAAFLPSYWLRSRIKARGKRALRELPDVLDLLTVSLEAGLGFDASLSKLVNKKKGVLGDEFQRCLEEIWLGKTRRDALLGVKERIDVHEIKVLISSILQAEKLGIGLVQVLRVQSVEVRDQRKQRAEEEAMKAPIKMLFPLVLFIFPSLFIVLLGPAVIQFIETFSN